MQNSARGPPARARADPLVLSRILTDIDEFCSCCSRIRSLQGVCIEIQCKCTEGLGGAIPIPDGNSVSANLSSLTPEL